MGFLSSLWNGVKGVAKGVTGVVGSLGIPVVSDVAGAVNSIISKNDANKFSESMLDKQIAAQQAANQANIANQNAINQRNIDFAREINSIMRHDARRQVSYKREDLARAGYSAASPDLTGYSPATLSSPTMQMAQVSPDIDPGMVQSAISARSSRLASDVQLDQNIVDLLVKRAQAKNLGSDTKGKDIDNAWNDVTFQARFDNLKESTNEIVSRHNLNKVQATKLADEIQNIRTTGEILQQDLNMKKFDSSKQQERYTREVQEVVARISKLQFDSDVSKLTKEIKQVEKEWMSLGISPSATDPFSALIRVVASPHGSELAPRIAQFLIDTVLNQIKFNGGLVGKVAEFFSGDDSDDDN